MRKIIIYLSLAVIVGIAAFFRLYNVSTNPPSLTWDEAAVGYNAYTILNWGKDEWGNNYPLFFKSFGDDKNPIHIYLTIPFIACFGLNDFAVRLPAAIFGVLNVLIIFFVARQLTKSNIISLFSSLFLAISAYNIQFSRFNHELNFAIFFFLLGLYFFLTAVNSDKKYLLPLSFMSFGLDLFTYPSAKVVTPILIFFLILLNIKKLLKNIKIFAISISVYLFFVGTIIVNPELLGTARLEQNQIKEELIINTNLYQKTNSLLLGKAEIVFERYLKYYQSDFLYLTGDKNPRHSVQAFGTFYKFQIPLLIIGLLYLIYAVIKYKNYNLLLILLCFFIAPLPGAVSSDMPHASRSMFITFSHYLLIAMGVFAIASLFKNFYYKILAVVVIVILTAFNFYNYNNYYYSEYKNKYSVEWIYGMKEIIEEAKKDEYYRVYITDSRMQPYIFALFYNQTSLPDFLKTVKYNETQSKPHNLVRSFDKYRFVWNEYEIVPNQKVLFVVKPSVYDGLYFKNDFKVVKVIKYLNNIDAFYLITGKEEIKNEE